uniref:CAAX prenyl protease 2/Lysostaphin resistance protein A-like domain-containing protein n=1 Tax=Tetradesmus obliquus TaxID=3088 RepID=A0A383VMF1_TETOB|eukprot:jgi/Sobl393_1/5754/SZX66103.1
MLRKPSSSLVQGSRFSPAATALSAKQHPQQHFGHLPKHRRAAPLQAAEKPEKLPAGVASDAAQQQQHAAAPQQQQQPATPQLLQLQSHRQQQQRQRDAASGELAAAQPALQQQVSQLDATRARYEVPWDIWEFIQVTAAVWVINMAIPFAVLSSAAHVQGFELSTIPTAEKELLNLLCQVLQLGSTAFIINSSTSKHQPLPKPWFMTEFATIPLFQALATAIAAVGSGVLLAGFMTGHVDGEEEWRHLAGLHQDDVGTLALVLGALLLAPATEELYFRGYVLPSLTKWTHPGLAVLLTGLLFASAHPADSFLPEALLGCILSGSLLAADGNLLVPLLAHSMYNAVVLGTEFLL